MKLKKLDRLMTQIKVTNVMNQDVDVVNNSDLMMLGKGRQGAVFKFSAEVCVKVFGNQEDCEREHYALSLGQGTNLLPKIYAKGPLYIAMEIIRGVDLREYLQSQPLTKELSKKLIEMLVTFKKIGFERIDHHKRQIFVQQDGSLKVIDVARTVWRDRVYPYPQKLLNSLGDEYKTVFLSHVKELAPDLYKEWEHYIRMEELSRKIYPVLITESKDKDKLKKLAKNLLTTKDETTYYSHLEGLMHKVFKEEWVKVMLARGYEPDKVMQKIDEYWGGFEKKYQAILKENKNSHKDKEERKQKSDKESSKKSKNKHHKDSKRHHEKDKHKRKHHHRH